MKNMKINIELCLLGIVLLIKIRLLDYRKNNNIQKKNKNLWMKQHKLINKIMRIYMNKILKFISLYIVKNVKRKLAIMNSVLKFIIFLM